MQDGSLLKEHVALPRIYAWFSSLLLDDFQLMQDLLNDGMPIDVPHPLRHTTALMEASRLGRTAMVEWLLNRGAAPAFLSGLPRGTALHWALRCRHWETALTLVNALEQTDMIDAYSRTALHAVSVDAVSEDAMAMAMEIVNLLVGKGCPLDARDHEGVTALHYAVIQDSARLTELLLVHGANPNIQTPDMLVSPLMIAALEQNTVISAILLQHGADIHAKNRDGVSALQMFPELQHSAAGGRADLVGIEPLSMVINPTSSDVIH